LFIITSTTEGAWLSEITHPYWHLAERGVEVDFASPKGGKIVWLTWSDPYDPNSQEANDLVSKGFLSDQKLVERLETTLKLSDIDLSRYDAVHVAGGIGAAIDLFPNDEVARVLEHFYAQNQIVGAICHGSIALANNPNRVNGRRATGYSLVEELEAETLFGKDFLPNYPQPAMEKAGVVFASAEPHGVCVIVDGNIVTGQNQQSASEYGLAFHHALLGRNPVAITGDAA
jgi:putative intracellular protease/amidase